MLKTVVLDALWSGEKLRHKVLGKLPTELIGEILNELVRQVGDPNGQADSAAKVKALNCAGNLVRSFLSNRADRKRTHMGQCLAALHQRMDSSNQGYALGLLLAGALKYRFERKQGSLGNVVQPVGNIVWAASSFDPNGGAALGLAAVLAQICFESGRKASKYLQTSRSIKSWAQLQLGNANAYLDFDKVLNANGIP